MAVPKKRTSKMKRNIHRTNWKRKVIKQIQKSISLTKSISTGKITNFILKTK